VNAYPAEIVPKARLEKGPGDQAERLAGRAEHVVDDWRRLRRKLIIANGRPL
jgi:hypothetical protein